MTHSSLSHLSPQQRSLLMERLRQARTAQPTSDEDISTLTREDGRAYPLSFAQERLWFLHQFAPHDTAYSVPLTFRIMGPFQPAALEQGLNAIMRRHEILRTTFTMVDNQPMQRIAPALHLEIPVKDLRAGNFEERDRLIREHISQNIRQPFDLEHGSLLRAAILRVGDEEWIFTLTMHHIICDGSSGAVLFRELRALYTAFAHETVANLAPLPVQYVDFAHWQRQRLQGERLATQLAYWQQKLSADIPVLELPTLQPTSTALRPTGRVHMTFPAPLAARLKELGQQENTTLFMVLLAAFQVLLARYSGQTDIVVGTPIVNRGHEKLQNLIGLFLNTLVLRTDLAGDPDFCELLGRVRTVCLEAYAHQDLPFEKLVEVLQPKRRLDQTPFFQFLFSFEQGASLPVQLADATLEPLEFANGMEKFDLTWALEEANGILQATIGYNTNMFVAATIQQMLTQYQTLLACITAHPQKRISELSLLTDSARVQLLEQWNVNATTPIPATTIHALFEAQVRRTPDTTAVLDNDGHLTYMCLNRRANQLAHLLRTRGVGPETLVGLCLARNVDMLVGLLGILKAGGAYLPLDSTYPRERLAFVLADANIKILVTQQDLLPHLEDSEASLLYLDSDAASIMSQTPDDPQVSMSTENCAYIIYTSGSTGRPKGVQIPHRAVVSFLQSMHQTPGMTAKDTLLAVTTLAFDIAGLELFLPLIAGARVVIANRDTATSGSTLITMLHKTQATLMQATPITWRILLEAGWQGTPQLKMLCGGEALPPELVPRLLDRGYALYNMFGPTETTIWSTCSQITRDEAVLSIGRPIANTSVYVLDECGKPVPVGVPGELYIGGAGVARGYLQRPELTAERFVPDPFSKTPGQRLYRTGDRVRYLTNGTLEYIGRKDEQVKLRGYRIELKEIETVLKRHSSVKDAVVVIEDDADGAQQLSAYVIPQTQAVTSAELYAHLQVYLPQYMLPAQFITLERFPVTPNGKLDRRGLRALMRPAQAEAACYTAPRTTREEQLAHIWSEELGIERVGIDDNFFLLGGHSLKAIQVAVRIREILGIQLPLRQLFAYPTIRLLQQPLEQAEQGTMQEITRLPEQQAYALSPAQLRFWLLQQIDPESAAYTILHCIPFTGPIVYKKLEKALLQIIARHESLRTAFHLVENNPVQIIEPVPEHILSHVDLRSYTPEKRRDHLEKLRYTALQSRFNLRHAPLLRAVFLRTGDEEGELHLSLHHIICDGWSLEVLQRELLICYQDSLREKEPELPKLPLQYRDYAAWQNNLLTTPGMQKHQHFWQQYLQQPLPELALYTDYVREEPESRLGSGYRFILTGTEYAQIKQMAAQQQVSLFMICTAVLTIWLARLTGQTDILIAAPLSGREHTATRSLVGLFLNTVLLRNQLHPRDTFATLLQRVRASTLEAMEHQMYPFEKLLEQIEVTRQIGRFPLTPVLLNMLNFPRERIAEIEQEEIGLHTLQLEVKNDFNFHINEYSNGLDITCHYRHDLFRDDTIVYLMEAYRQALIDVAQDQQILLQELAMFPAHPLPIHREQIEMEHEYKQLLGSTIFAHFQRQAVARPDAYAVVTAQDSVTYAQLSVRAQHIAQAIQQHTAHHQAPPRVALLFTSGVEMIAALLGVLQAGGAFIALDPDYPLARLSATLHDSQPVLMLTHPPVEEKAQQLCAQQEALPCLDVQHLADTTIAPNTHREKPEGLAYILYTSGSTGTPKGVLQTQRNVLHFIASYAQALRLRPKDRLTLISSYAFDGAIMDIFGALLNGCTLYPLHLLEQETFADLWKWLQERQITIWHSIPAVYRTFLQSISSPQAGAATALRQIVLGGEEVSAHDVQTHQQSSNGQLPLMNLYGQSESSLSTYAIYDRQWRNERVSIGRPVAETQITVQTEMGRSAYTYEEGELLIHSPYTSPGYWHTGAQTPFVTDPQGHCRTYYSGDLVRVLPGGRLLFTGRKDFQVKIRGYRIETAEIEQALLSSSLVQEAAVQKRFVAGVEQLVAYIVAETEGTKNSVQLRATLAKRLPSYMLPGQLIWLEALPKTPGGKLDRAALPAPTQEQQDTGEHFVQATTPLEEKLLLLWQELLGKHSISTNANFFALGGHSLLVVQLQTRIKEHIGINLSLRKLFEHATIAAQAVALLEAQLAALDGQDFERMLREMEQD